MGVISLDDVHTMFALIMVPVFSTPMEEPPVNVK